MTAAVCHRCGGPVPVPAYLSHLGCFRCTACCPTDADILPIAIERGREAAKPGKPNKTISFAKGMSIGLAGTPKRGRSAR